jgi:N-dimethylarginine dimethylaminohydrolase
VGELAEEFDAEGDRLVVDWDVVVGEEQERAQRAVINTVAATLKEFVLIAVSPLRMN